MFNMARRLKLSSSQRLDTLPCLHLPQPHSLWTQYLHKQDHSTVLDCILDPPPGGLHALPIPLTNWFNLSAPREQRTDRTHKLHLRELLPQTYAVTVCPRQEGPAGRIEEGFAIKDEALSGVTASIRSKGGAFDPPRWTPHIGVIASVARVGVNGGEGEDDVHSRGEEHGFPADLQRARCGASGLDNGGEWRGGAEGLILYDHDGDPLS